MKNYDSISFDLENSSESPINNYSGIGCANTEIQEKPFDLFETLGNCLMPVRKYTLKEQIYNLKNN